MFSKIIPAEKRHILGIQALNKKCLWLPELKEIDPFIWCELWWIESFLDHFYVIEEQGSVIAALSVYYDPITTKTELITIAVSEAHQGKGLGKLLVAYAKKVAKLADSKILELGSFIAYKKGEFYKSQGFNETEILYCEEIRFGKKFPYYNMEMTL